MSRKFRRLHPFEDGVYAEDEFGDCWVLHKDSMEWLPLPPLPDFTEKESEEELQSFMNSVERHTNMPSPLILLSGAIYLAGAAFIVYELAKMAISAFTN